MRRNPIYVFEDRNSVGINKVPLDSTIQINDADGNGNPVIVQLVDKSNFDATTTIGDFLDNENSYEKPTTIPPDLKGYVDVTEDENGEAALRVINTNIATRAIVEPNAIYFRDNVAGESYGILFDETNTELDFKLKNVTSFSAGYQRPPHTQYQPISVNDLTRKDYVDGLLDSKFDKAGGVIGAGSTNTKITIAGVNPRIHFSPDSPTDNQYIEGIGSTGNGVWFVGRGIDNDDSLWLSNDIDDTNGNDSHIVLNVDGTAEIKQSLKITDVNRTPFATFDYPRSRFDTHLEIKETLTVEGSGYTGSATIYFGNTNQTPGKEEPAIFWSHSNDEFRISYANVAPESYTLWHAGTFNPDSKFDKAGGELNRDGQIIARFEPTDILLNGEVTVGEVINIGVGTSGSSIIAFKDTNNTNTKPGLYWSNNDSAFKITDNLMDSTESYKILSEKNIATAVSDIANPGTATTEDIANKVNELLGNLRLAGLLSV